MYQLLVHFFTVILNYDIQIQKIDEYHFKVTCDQFSDLSYQENYVSNLLESYGLNNVVTIQDSNTILIDFTIRWEDQIERSSYKFLEPCVDHWSPQDLNRYATAIEASNLWEKRAKLASNLLLLYNWYPKQKVSKIALSVEQGKVSQLLTYSESKSSTVFQKIDGEVELRNLGRLANTFQPFNSLVFAYFDNFKDSRGIELEFLPSGASLNSQYYSEEQLVGLKAASRHIGSSSDQWMKISKLHQLMGKFKKVLI